MWQFVQVAYKPPGKASVFDEISPCIHVSRDANSPDGAHRYRKLVHASRTAYSFDIVINNLGTENPSFEGTLSMPNPVTMATDVYVWRGDFVCKKQVTVEAVKVEIEKPKDLEGTLEELRSISPLQWQDEGELKKGEDAAQHTGNGIMQKVVPPTITVLLDPLLTPPRS